MLIEYVNLLRKPEDKQEEDKYIWNQKKGYITRQEEDKLLLDSCIPATLPQEEKKMFDFDNGDTTSNAAVKHHIDTRDWFLSELNEIESVHKEKAQKAFNIANDEWPNSGAEFVDRIKAGKFVMNDPDNASGYFSVWNIPRCIVWRDPNIVPDTKAYEKVCEAINAAKQRIVRHFMASTYTGDFVNKLEKFEKMDFLPAPPAAANDTAPIAQEIAIAA